MKKQALHSKPSTVSTVCIHTSIYPPSGLWLVTTAGRFLPQPSLSLSLTHSLTFQVRRRAIMTESLTDWEKKSSLHSLITHTLEWGCVWMTSQLKWHQTVQGERKEICCTDFFSRRLEKEWNYSVAAATKSKWTPAEFALKYLRRYTTLTFSLP